MTFQVKFLENFLDITNSSSNIKCLIGGWHMKKPQWNHILIAYTNKIMHLVSCIICVLYFKQVQLIHQHLRDQPIKKYFKIWCTWLKMQVVVKLDSQCDFDADFSFKHWLLEGVFLCIVLILKYDLQVFQNLVEECRCM